MILYLHGFTSSAGSTKAKYFAERLREHGMGLGCPDFNEPDFRTLTMTRMLEQLEREIEPASGPVTLIGSSLGGTLAIIAASRFGARIGRVVLLAPAVMFARPGHHILAPERIEQWRQDGAMSFFHHAYGEERPLAYAFHEDSVRYDPFEAFMPNQTLIFQGLHDQSVDYRAVEAFARARPNVTLSLLDDDHQLMSSLPLIWDGVAAFLGLVA